MEKKSRTIWIVFISAFMLLASNAATSASLLFIELTPTTERESNASPCSSHNDSSVSHGHQMDIQNSASQSICDEHNSDSGNCCGMACSASSSIINTFSFKTVKTHFVHKLNLEIGAVIERAQSLFRPPIM